MLGIGDGASTRCSQVKTAQPLPGGISPGLVGMQSCSSAHRVDLKKTSGIRLLQSVSAIFVGCPASQSLCCAAQSNCTPGEMARDPVLILFQ